MYTKEQQERALKEFACLGSVQAVINLSTRNTLYEWNKAVRANKQNHHGSLDKPHVIKNRNINSPSHPRNPDINVKLDAIYRCFSLGEGVEYISKEIGYSRASIYTWYRKYQKFGVAGLMASKKHIKREEINFNVNTPKEQNLTELQEQIKQLQMKVDVLKGTLNILKKYQGVNVAKLKNREKAVVIDAVKDKYPLPQLLKCL